MDYQKIRAAIEQPLLTAFNNLSPAVPVYFDNITAAPKNITTEYVRVNVTFGLSNQTTLTGTLDDAKGAVVVRVFTAKGLGPARNQTLLTTAVDVMETLNSAAKPATGTFFRLTEIDGPSFSADETSPHFVSTIQATYRATVLP